MADVRDIRPDAETTLGMLMATVKRLADGQNKLSSDVAQIRVAVDAFPKLVADAAAENRRYYRGLQERLDEELGSDYDDISGSHDVRSLRDAGRNWRARARQEEDARIKEAAAREVEAAKAARSKLTAQIATGVAAVAGILQGLQLAGWIK